MIVTIGRSSNGRTIDSGSIYLGSSPSLPASRFDIIKNMKLISINVELNRHKKTILDFLKKERADVICMQELLEEDFVFF